MSIADVAVVQRLVAGRGHFIDVAFRSERFAERRCLVKNRSLLFCIEPLREQKDMAVRHVHDIGRLQRGGG